MKKEKPLLKFKRKLDWIYILGIFFVVLFIVIYFIIVIVTAKVNFYSFFFHNISEHLLLMVLSLFHVSLLAIGMILMIFSFFNMPIALYCYSDRFVVSLFLQKKKEILYKDISDISVVICVSSFKKDNKECRVIFNNKIYSFYLAYPVSGYFDEVVICHKKDKSDLLRRVHAKKKDVDLILSLLKKYYSKKIPYLPDEEAL